ncbi:MAG: flippase-like domain-containing protein [Bacteroidales bacterium]|nr:flippase-like domain-containing protein [Bacteroidales bacterium]
MQKYLSTAIKIIVPLMISAAILWWMYRGMDWQLIVDALNDGMDWTWMLLSLPFGVLAEALRGYRWKLAIDPLGVRTRNHVCVNAIFLSYGSSLVVPRVGEFLRCGVLKRYDNVPFARAMGTVVTERCIDVIIILVLSAVTVLLQIPVFARIASETGMSFDGIFGKFTATGYVVTIACILLIGLMTWWVSRKLNLFSRIRAILKDLKDGLFSIRYIRQRGLFLLYSVGIWVAYFLHFYLTFFCFDYTAGLGFQVALVAFVVGTFAVLVPTPNGAGPWHFAVKTVLVLFGVAQTDGAVFVLIVHTIQTALVALLGVYSSIALGMTKKKNRTN